MHSLPMNADAKYRPSGGEYYRDLHSIVVQYKGCIYTCKLRLGHFDSSKKKLSSRDRHESTNWNARHDQAAS